MSPVSNRGHPRILGNPTQYCTLRHTSENQPDSSGLFELIRAD
jgi:hypothetical protein